MYTHWNLAVLCTSEFSTHLFIVSIKTYDIIGDVMQWHHHNQVMKGFPTKILKLYSKREYSHSHDILPLFSLLCPHDRQWFWPTFLQCETKLSNGNSKWYLKYSSLLTNTVFSFLYIYFFTSSILLFCLEICSEVSSNSPC